MGIGDWEGVETENMEGSAHNRTYGGTKRDESTYSIIPIKGRYSREGRDWHSSYPMT